MSKNRMILAAAGGVIAVAAVAASVFAYLSFAAMVAAEEGDDEGGDGRMHFVDKARSLSTGGGRRDRSDEHVYPCAESVKALDANTEKMTGWLKAVRVYAAAGDRVFDKTTPAAFKTFIVRDAKRLASLPGEASGALARPDFAFGPFGTYIAGGKMPEEQQLPVLQRRWDDVATIMETMATNGVSEVTDVQFKAEEAKPETEAEDPKARRAAARQKKAKAAKAAAAPTALSDAQTYVFAFTARPQALVRVVNAFATSERFITVEDFTFRRTRDGIAETLAGDEKKNEAAPVSGRRRRRGASPAPAAEEKSDAKASGIVTDPALDAPLSVTMTLTVHDFRSLEDSEKTEEEQK